MSAKFKFHITGKSNLVYVAFFNNNFEENLTKVNSDEFDLSEFHSENEVDSCMPGNGLELDGIKLIKVFKNDELIYEDNSLQVLDSVNDGENLDPIKGSIMIVQNSTEWTDINGILLPNNIKTSCFSTTLNEFTQKYQFCSIETVEGYKVEGVATIDIDENISPSYKDFEWVTMSYDTSGLADKVYKSTGTNTTLIGVKYQNEYYELDCTDEGGTNEFSYYKKVDGKWEWAEDIQSKIDELS